MICRLAVLWLFVVILTGGPATAAAELGLTQLGGRWCSDGDTCYLFAPGLPAPLRLLKIRIRGIDAPEISGKCDAERAAALRARDYLNRLVDAAQRVELGRMKWGKFGGRVIADMRLDGLDVAQAMIAAGLARAYDGETKRAGWCNADQD